MLSGAAAWSCHPSGIHCSTLSKTRHSSSTQPWKRPTMGPYMASAMDQHDFDCRAIKKAWATSMQKIFVAIRLLVVMV